MIRGYTENGSIYIGFVRGPLLDKLIAGARVCLPGYVDATGVRYPHVCLFVGDSNAHLIERCNGLFPDGLLPGAVVVHVTSEEPDGS